MSTAEPPIRFEEGDKLTRAIAAPDWHKAANRYQCRVLICPEEEGGYSAHALRLPGAVSQGETIEETLANIAEACGGVLGEYLDAGEGIPWADVKVDDIPPDSIERWIVVDVH